MFLLLTLYADNFSLMLLDQFFQLFMKLNLLLYVLLQNFFFLLNQFYFFFEIFLVFNAQNTALLNLGKS